MIHLSKAVRVLMVTEMAEVFGYFMLQAILILYLLNQFSLSDKEAYAFSGQFLALAFLMPVIGGWIADRILGARDAILCGGLLLSIGYACLIFGAALFFIGFSLIIVGHGLFKSSIASFVAECDENHDTRRARFTLVYTSINVASLCAMVSVGYIQKSFNWEACFAAASFSALIGVCCFRWGFKYFNHKNFFWNKDKYIGILFILIILIFVYFSLKLQFFKNHGLYLFGFLFSLYITKIYFDLNKQERYQFLAMMLLLIIAIWYKTMFFETYLVVNVFTERLIDRNVLGHDVPTAVFLSFGSLFSLILGPIFAYIWQYKKIKISIPLAFAISILIMGISMQLLAWALEIQTSEKLPAVLIVLFRLLFAIGELFILPIGLSMVAQYAPKRHLGLLMGAWYLTAAFGGKLAALLADYAHIPQGISDSAQLKNIYHFAFQQYAIFNFAIFIFCLIILLPIINQFQRFHFKNNGVYTPYPLL